MQQTARDEEVSETKEVAEEKPKSSPKLKRKPSKLTKPKAPKLDKIVDCLFYKVEPLTIYHLIYIYMYIHKMYLLHIFY